LHNINKDKKKLPIIRHPTDVLKAESGATGNSGCKVCRRCIHVLYDNIIFHLGNVYDFLLADITETSTGGGCHRVPIFGARRRDGELHQIKIGKNIING
jgi:hypothetical protein